MQTTMLKPTFNNYIDVTTLDKNRPRTVVFYGRVSTEHEAQLSALENQMQWYEETASHYPNWTVIDKYIDEGITGTQAKKRPAFLKMIEDAKTGKFDLIVTREVCRFARNTVDTLNYTRQLRNLGVEVFFVGDSIRTFDNDGELKLSLMATFAQEESRKVSERVKAGQKISRENKTLYGNGNILGYDLDKEHNTYVINPEQAETVRIIFDMYSQGEGGLRIAKKLTELKRLNSSGRVKWDAAVILRVLANATYMGYNCYNKSRSSNYLEQRRINNHDEETYVYEKGDFEPIISEELWHRCYEIRKSKNKPSVVENGVVKKMSHRNSKDFWQTKLRCKCGSTFRKDPWHKKKNGEISYGYSCYNRLNNGYSKFREKNGLDTEGYCDMRMICDWKLGLMENEIFSNIQIDKCKAATELLGYIRKYYQSETADKNGNSIEYIHKQREKLEQKRKNIMNMRAEGEIDKDDYIEMKKEVEAELARIDSQEKNISEQQNLQNDMFGQLSRIEQSLKEYSESVGTEIEKEIQRQLISTVTPINTERFVWEISTGKNKTAKLHCNVRGRKNKAVISIDEFTDGDEKSPIHIDKKSSAQENLLRRLLQIGISPKLSISWDFPITYEMARAYQKAHGRYLRKNQWFDITLVMCLELG